MTTQGAIPASLHYATFTTMPAPSRWERVGHSRYKSSAPCTICSKSLKKDVTVGHEYTEDDMTAQKTSHLFHSKCIQAWLAPGAQSACPQCNLPIDNRIKFWSDAGYKVAKATRTQELARVLELNSIDPIRLIAANGEIEPFSERLFTAIMQVHEAAIESASESASRTVEMTPDCEGEFIFRGEHLIEDRPKPIDADVSAALKRSFPEFELGFAVAPKNMLPLHVFAALKRSFPEFALIGLRPIQIISLIQAGKNVTETALLVTICYEISEILGTKLHSDDVKHEIRSVIENDLVCCSNNHIKALLFAYTLWQPKANMNREMIPFYNHAVSTVSYSGSTYILPYLMAPPLTKQRLEQLKSPEEEQEHLDLIEMKRIERHFAAIRIFEELGPLIERKYRTKKSNAAGLST